MKRIIIAIFCVLLILSFISFGKANPKIKVSLSLVNEQGQGISNAEIESSNKVFVSDANGRAEIVLQQGPDVLIVNAKGFLTQIVPVGWDSNNRHLKVKLLSDNNGRRVVINFAGDVMFGRRYLENTSDSPLTSPTSTTAGAIEVIKNVAKAFSAADVSCINFESVIGKFGEDQAYKGKTNIQSPPESIEALKSLGVDVVALANEHIQDYYDDGVNNTISLLQKANISAVGAGTEKSAKAASVIEKKNTKVGTLAFTTITGTFDDMDFPDNSMLMPDDVKKSDKWIWEKRLWGWTGTGWSMPKGEYRIGEIWKNYVEVQQKLPPDIQSQIWKSLILTFPEIKDYAADRGHSGANAWDLEKSVADIKAFRKQADILVVQLHAGIQGQTAPSSAVITAAHAAIDAGADIVIGHHPHVLQRMEWYKGHLIVYSLGNFVYDQNLFDAFSSGFLRTVWEGNKLIEARFIPVEIVGYKPALATDISAKKIINQVWEKSILSEQIKRKEGDYIIIKNLWDDFSKPVYFKNEWGTAKILKSGKKQSYMLNIKSGEVANLDSDALWPAQLGTEQKFSEGQLLVGRDLFKWGHFQDTLADGQQIGTVHLMLDKIIKPWHESKGNGYLELVASSNDKIDVKVKTVAKIPITQHRLYDSSNLPLDPNAAYTVRMDVKTKGEVAANLRIASYSDSDLLGQKRYNIPNSQNNWKTVEIPISVVNKGNKQANAISIYLELNLPSKNKCILDIDNLEVIEWRDSSLMPDIYGAYTHVKNLGKPVSLKFDILKD